MTEIIKLYGPPGTGKTSTLIKLLQQEFKQDDDLTLKDVVFVSFSNSAINEVCDRLGTTKGGKTTPYFRTLHGLVLSCLIKQESISMELTRWMHRHGFVEGLQAEFCGKLGIPFERENTTGSSDALGNQAFTSWTAIVGEYYPQVKDIEKCLDLLYGFNYTFGDIINQWLHFKEKAGFFDYNDILIETYESDIQIDAKIGFFDEFQDFNRLEFEVSKKIMDELERVYVAGDDDQAIYGWKGSKPDFFLDLKGREIILSKTHRLPSEIWNFAEKIIRNVRRRREKLIQTTNKAGIVQYLPQTSLEQLTLLSAQLSMKYPDLTVYLLLRTNHLVYQAESILLENAIPFKRLKGRSLWDRELIMTWNITAKLRQGNELNTDELEFLIQNANPNFIPEESKDQLLKAVKSGNIPIELFEILRRVPITDLIRIRKKKARELVRKAYNPLDFGRINLYVDTIHASKGKEADIVILADAITHTIESAINNGFKDAELRVFYVGSTRARRMLLVAPLFGFKPFIQREVIIPC